MTPDLRLFAPSVARNRLPIREVLSRHLPPSGTVLEIASGSGEHCVFFAEARPALTFQPSDPDPTARDSIDAWTRMMSLGNVRAALALDAASDDWPLASADAVLCINMIHISPWRATEGLVRGAARILPAGGLLYCYGPYRRDGGHTAASNAAFDRDLRGRNPDWGVRDLESVADLAVAAGYAAPLIESMPANNLSLIFRKHA